LASATIENGQKEKHRPKRGRGRGERKRGRVGVELNTNHPAFENVTTNTIKILQKKGEV